MEGYPWWQHLHPRWWATTALYWALQRQVVETLAAVLENKEGT
jgi:hypothetical protein